MARLHRRLGAITGLAFMATVAVGMGIGAVVRAAAPAPGEAERSAVERLATALAAELAAACPVRDASDRQAFEACRQAVFNDSLFRRSLAPRLLWGRQANDPATPLKDSRLTQFVPEVYAGLYLPIFMFDGQSEVAWVESEKLYRIKLGATFRNRLPPGFFPYPFWHDAAKWSAYENANALLLWVSPGARPEVRVAQFTWQSGPPPGVAVSKVSTPRFDGRWLWTDEAGKTQPAVTLFDGLYSDGNPYKAQLDERFRALATALRQGQCLDCHVPSNPHGQKRLVLLQTPAHAAGEIGRILRTVRSDRMPVDELGVESALPADVKQSLIRQGEAFEAAVTAARRWEGDRRRAASAPAP